jgi:hypothetical protein
MSNNQLIGMKFVEITQIDCFNAEEIFQVKKESVFAWLDGFKNEIFGH